MSTPIIFFVIMFAIGLFVPVFQQAFKFSKEKFVKLNSKQKIIFTLVVIVLFFVLLFLGRIPVVGQTIWHSIAGLVAGLVVRKSRQEKAAQKALAEQQAQQNQQPQPPQAANDK